MRLSYHWDPKGGESVFTIHLPASEVEEFEVDATYREMLFSRVSTMADRLLALSWVARYADRKEREEEAQDAEVQGKAD